MAISFVTHKRVIEILWCLSVWWKNNNKEQSSCSLALSTVENRKKNKMSLKFNYFSCPSMNAIDEPLDLEASSMH